MKKHKIVVILVLILMSGVALFLIRGQKKNLPVETMFLGAKEYKTTFQESVNNAKPFFDLFNKALEASNSGNEETAIRLLNQSISYANHGFAKGMVYKRLAEIYRIQGKLKEELSYLEQIPKYSMNKELNQECLNRASEIRRLLALKHDTNEPSRVKQP